MTTIQILNQALDKADSENNKTLKLIIQSVIVIELDNRSKELLSAIEPILDNMLQEAQTLRAKITDTY